MLPEKFVFFKGPMRLIIRTLTLKPLSEGRILYVAATRCFHSPRELKICDILFYKTQATATNTEYSSLQKGGYVCSS